MKETLKGNQSETLREIYEGDFKKGPGNTLKKTYERDL